MRAVAAGELSAEQAASQADEQALALLSGATIDLGRAARCRFGEVIYGEGKSPELILEIAETLLAHGQEVLVTRIAPETASRMVAHFGHHRWHPEARTLRLHRRPIAPLPRWTPPLPPAPKIGGNGSPDRAKQQTEPQLGQEQPDLHVGVVTAGSTDRSVAAEALETLDWMGVPVDWIEDVGVAGPQRLLAVVPRLRVATAIVVVAGMEGALASMVGGHVGCPVIAVPTSVGYGSNFAGLTPLLGMLTSCASNVSVVGIDAGFKGGYVAGLIATQLRDLARQHFAAHRSPDSPSGE
ncbi:MAG: phosphoribosyl carboxyaminoimidazole mutase [Planctomycetaceae bacterium]|nr:MAG: phosphoribosyl carboxyaminoimidazole mutase [Planctomycetaceae bacterium]